MLLVLAGDFRPAIFRPVDGKNVSAWSDLPITAQGVDPVIAQKLESVDGAVIAVTIPPNRLRQGQRIARFGAKRMDGDTGPLSAVLEHDFVRLAHLEGMVRTIAQLRKEGKL